MNRAARLLFLLLFTAVTARAHPILQNPLWIDPCPQSVTVYLDVSVRELNVVQNLPLGTDGGFDLSQAEEFAERHKDYVLDHFHVKADGKEIKGSVTTIVPPDMKNTRPALELPDNSRFRYVIHYPLPAAPAVLSFRQNMCVEFPSAPGVPWDLSYEYRYGAAPLESPLQYGPLRRDSDLTFNTGYVGTAVAGTIVREPTPLSWAGLWLMFAAAMALGSSLTLRNCQVAAVLWMASYIGAEHLAVTIPVWLMALVSGACAILAAVDNIHGHGMELQPRRRVALLLIGSISFGMGLHDDRMTLNNSERLWPVLLFLSAIAAAVLIYGLKRLVSNRSGNAARVFLQTTSLAVCGAAIWFLLRVLHVK